jgi:hypothetical protein
VLFLFAALTFSILQVHPRQFPDTAGVVVINSADEWAKFAVDTPPRVDFRKNTVVVVFAGERPTGGWSVRVTGVDKRGSSCAVRYEVKGPPRGAMVTQVITHPYAVILLMGKCATAEAAAQGQAPPIM